MKKIIYSDKWGKILEVTRYRDTRRGKKGRFVSDRNAKRLLKGRPAVHPRIETAQYRIPAGETKPDYEAPHVVFRPPNYLMKSTFPEAEIDYQGNIFDMIEATNFFTQIGRGAWVSYQIRAWDDDKEKWVYGRGKIKLGPRHQAEQLTWAIAETIDNMQYEVSIQWDKSSKVRDATITGLTDITITTALMR